MKKQLLLSFLSVALISLCAPTRTLAQQDTKTKKHHRTRSYWGSWGYNEEVYTKSTVNVNQPSLGNNYDLVHVTARDHEGWDEGVFHKALTIPQYNYRLGCYFNDKQDLGIEVNFDHTKYLINDGMKHVTGTLNHRHVDTMINMSASTGFYYYLNNGANFLLFNIVKRLGLYYTQDNNLRVDLTGKAGIGPVIPHVQDAFFGQANTPHFQLGGWNTGVETALRVTIMKYGYLEFSQKVDYARYSNLKIYEGTAKQNFGTYEFILSIGAFIPNSRHNPLFESSKPAAIAQ